MKSFLIAAAALLVSTPAIAHPRFISKGHTYTYPSDNVMVRSDWRRCRKIKYITKYDEWGWYTERKILPIASCTRIRRNHSHVEPAKVKIIFR